MLRLLVMAGLMAVEISHVPGAHAAEPDAATIINSGSTNRSGFRIAVDPSGTAEMTSTPRRSGAPQEQPKTIQRMLARADVERFYNDLKAAKPFASLPAVHCMKSVSFGSTLTIAFGEEQTPDLSCGDGRNVPMRNLIRDANEIVALFQGN